LVILASGAIGALAASLPGIFAVRGALRRVLEA
jgi:hypothetical protein